MLQYFNSKAVIIFQVKTNERNKNLESILNAKKQISNLLFKSFFSHSNLNFLSVVAALVLKYASAEKAKDETSSPMWYSVILEENWDSICTQSL